jgi:hypothetical protein
MFLINGPLWIITVVVLTDLSTVDNVVDPFNNWVTHEFTDASTLYLTAPRISPALFAMNYEFMLGATDKPLNAGPH